MGIQMPNTFVNAIAFAIKSMSFITLFSLICKVKLK